MRILNVASYIVFIFSILDINLSTLTLIKK